MSRTGQMSRRLTRVSTQHQNGTVAHLIAEMAEGLGLDPADLRHEAAVLTRCFREAGAVTQDAQVAWVANDLGMSVAEVEAELAGMRERWA